MYVIPVHLLLILPNTYWASVACYGLSPTFNVSSKGSFAFWTIRHHLSTNTTPVHSLHMRFPVIPVLQLKQFSLRQTYNNLIIKTTELQHVSASYSHHQVCLN
jgi:hypothetical protein